MDFGCGRTKPSAATCALTSLERRRASDEWMMRMAGFAIRDQDVRRSVARTADKTRRRPEKLRRRLVSAAGWTGGQQAVFGNSGAACQPFMHSDRILSASALAIPLVFSLHIAILLLAFSGLADRHDFMNALRSSPFLSVACSLQAFIFSCCGVIASVFFASVLVCAAYAVPKANSPTSSSVNIVFIRALQGWI